jgi:methylenetetrahydrofolate reductase (NADPH)
MTEDENAKTQGFIAMTDTKQAVINLFSDFTVETTPNSASKIPDFNARLRNDTPVYVTFLPGSDVYETVTVAKRLRGEGFNPIPHIAARSLQSEDMLSEILKRYVGEAGVEHVLTIAGGVDNPLGPYESSMAVLESGLIDKAGISKVSVAGHPEGSPDITDEAIKEALAWKNSFAERTGAELDIVTQFAFEAEPLIAWDRRINAEGNTLPIRIGLPGLATIKTLLGFSKAAGVGNSIRFLMKRAADVTKLMTVNAPDKQVIDLARYVAEDANAGISGVHMYAIGGLKRSSAWSYALRDGLFDVTNQDQIKVAVDLG